MTGEESPLLIEPVVSWPRRAETECDYLVTVDLRGSLPTAADGTSVWPYADEEFTFTVTLDGSPHLDCAALEEPSVVLHRFGGTYGPARFRVSTGRETGIASLWLTVSNQWGVPVRKAELRSEIRSREPGRAPLGQLVRQVDAPHPRMTADPQTPLDGPAAHSLVVNASQVVTISFAGFNRAWAVWLGDRLERRGLRVVHVRCDASAAISLVDHLRGLSLAEGRVLIVVSDRYLRLGSRTHAEWNAALREVVAPEPTRFAAVSVTTEPVPTAFAVLAPVDLADIGPEEAERRLVERLGLTYEPLPEPIDGRRAPRFPSTMPEVWGNIPRRNTRFTGREPLLEKAYHLLNGSEPGAGVLTLYGMSGVGKTQLAAEYVYRWSSEYDAVWWVNAGSIVSYRRMLAELAPKLGLATGAEYSERLRAVRDALRRGEPYARWLLILDGADEPDQIWELLPTGPGHVLITSRNLEWGEYNSQLMQIPVYARDESVAFVQRRAPRLSEVEAGQLAEALEDLPLLLDQTAGWLNDSDLSVHDYIALLEGGIDQNVVKVSADFPLTFQAAWSILLNKLRETLPQAVDLLRLCTFFAPGIVPVRFLKEIPPDELPATLVGLLQDPLLWNRAITQLRKYSIVRLEYHESTSSPSLTSDESLYLHRMVHQLVRLDMPQSDRQEFIEVVRRALAAADPGRPTDIRMWDAYAEIVPHLKYANVLGGHDSRVHRLVLNCLRYMYFAGEYASGVRLGERALRAWRSSLGEHHPIFSELTYHYANLLRSSGDFQRTEALEREVADRLREERGEHDLDHLRAVNGLGADLWGLGRYAESLELYQWLHPTYRDLLGANDTRTLNALNNLGFAHRLLGHYQEALTIDRVTLDLRRRVLTARHPWTLQSETSYAIGLRLLGRYTEAESIQSENVRECRLLLGADNPQTLRAEHNLALCKLRSGDRRGAGALLNSVLDQYERKLGDRHAETLAAAVSHNCFTREYGDIDRARETSESIVVRYEQLLVAGHPFIPGVHDNHALILCRVGEIDHAHSVAERALTEMTSVLGEQHPYSLGCAINASALRNLVGDIEGAARLSRDAVSGAANCLGHAHPLTLSARVANAADLRALRDHRRARQVEQQALSDLESTLGKQHVHTISARSRNRPYWDFEPQAT